MRKIFTLLPVLAIGLFLMGCAGEDKNPTSPEPTATPAIQTHTITYKVTGVGALTYVTGINYGTNTSHVPIGVSQTTLPWTLDVSLQTGDGYSLNAFYDASEPVVLDPLTDKVKVEAYKDGAATPFHSETSGSSVINQTISGTIND